MKLEGYYTSGEFAKKAKVSVRTIRFYDKQDILKPSLVQNNSRYYTDDDFMQLQQILLLKYLGFSLDDIKEMTFGEVDYSLLLNSLKAQKRLVQDRMEQMQLVEQAIDNSISSIETNNELNGDEMLNLIHLTGMENSLKSQYKNTTNINARIQLHRDYSVNPQGWFPWIFEQLNLKDGEAVLELGCGNGSLWLENEGLIPENVEITLSDISSGMVRDVRRRISRKDKRFQFATIDCNSIPYEDQSFDVIIANHVLFYCENLDKVFKEVIRVLKPGGRFICSTYGENHMKEITEIAQSFDKHIVLSQENLYEKFGLQNGAQLLNKYFANVKCKQYEDEIIINQAEPLVEYILSCHGNQNQYLSMNYNAFKKHVEKTTKDELHITKEAGVFVCLK